MKLPQQLNLGVQDLGRADVTAPARIATAEYNASLAFSKAFDSFAKMAGDIGEVLDDKSGLLAQRRAELQTKQAIVDNQLFFKETRVIDPNSPDFKNLPPHVQRAVEQYTQSEGVNPDEPINTFDIAVEATRFLTEDLTNQADAMLKKFRNSNELRAGWYSTMASILPTAVSTIGTNAIEQELELQRAEVQTQVDEYIAAGDEIGARRTVTNAEANFIITPGQALEMSAPIGPTIDYMKIDRQIRSAETATQLEMVTDNLLVSRVAGDKRIQLRNLLHTRGEQLLADQARVKERTYAQGVQLLVNNEMTGAWINEQIRSDRLTGGQANTLRNAMNTPSPTVSDPDLLDTMRKRIVSMLTPGIEGGLTIPERADQLRAMVTGMATGVTAAGNPREKTITGEDMLNLLDEISKQENHALGKGTVISDFAERTIRAVTGFDSRFEEAFGSSNATGFAYLDFKAAVLDLMAMEGEQADVVGFITANTANYTAERYLGDLKEGMRTVVPKEWHGQLDGMGKDSDMTWIMGRARSELRRGKITQRTYNAIERRYQLNLNVIANQRKRITDPNSVRGDTTLDEDL